MQISGVMNAEELNAASYSAMERCEHELVDMELVAAQLSLKKPRRGGKRWLEPNGACGARGDP